MRNDALVSGCILVGLAVGGYLAFRHGFRMPWLLAAPGGLFLGFVVGVVLVIARESNPPDASAPRDGASDAVTTPAGSSIIDSTETERERENGR